MKRYYIILLSLFIFAGQTHSAVNGDYLPGELNIKFSSSGLEKKSAGSSADEMLARFGAHDIRQAFLIPPNLSAGKISAGARSRLESIASIKRVYFPENLDMEYVAKKLNAHPDIEYAEPVYISRFCDVPDDPAYDESKQNYLDFISAPQAWDIAHGDTSVVIAIVDSGTEWNHTDLRDNLWTNTGEIPGNGADDDDNGFVDDVHGWDFYGSVYFGRIIGDNDPTSTSEPHGTHVAGIAAAVTNNGIGVASLSYNVKYMPLKATPDDGEEVVSGFDAVLYAASNGADVINLSWGSQQQSSVGAEIIGFAAEMGAVIVASAGNEGSEKVFYPAAYPEVIAVGSIDLTGEKSAFSNYGPTVDISAPGSIIYSTVFNNSYGLMSGTSMAAPAVSALAALIKSAHSDWDSDQIRAQIVSTASPITTGDSYEYLCGGGYINAEKALGESVLHIDVSEYAFSDKNGNNDGLFTRGERIEASFTFKNCGEKTDNVTVSFSSLTGYLIPLKTSFSMAALDHKEERTFTDFQFTVKEDAPVNSREIIHLNCEDTTNGSINFATIDVVVNPSYATFTANKIEISIDDRGHIGYTDFPDNTRGSGFIVHEDSQDETDFFNVPLLFEGGLLIGNSENRISDGTRGAEYGVREEDFVSAEQFIFENAPDDSMQVGTVVFTDEGAGSESYGIKVTLKTTAYKKPEHDQYIIFEYTFENESNKTLSGLRAGLFLDFDIPDSGGNDDYAFYAPEDDILVMSGEPDMQNDTFMVGAAVTDSIYTPWLIDNEGTDDYSFSIYDGFTEEEKWLSLSAGKTEVIEKGPGDVSMVLSPESFDLEPGGEKKVAFILAYGLGYEDLKARIANARTRTNQDLPAHVENPANIRQQGLFSINSIYPNPFNPATTISIGLPVADTIAINVYDILGRHVHTVFHGFKSAGQYDIQFNGKQLSSGIYFVSLETESGFTSFKKITVLK